MRGAARGSPERLGITRVQFLERRAQAFDALAHRFAVDAGIAEKHPLHGRRVAVVPRERREVDAVPERRCEHVAIVELLPEMTDHLHARIRLVDDQPAIEALAAERDELALAAGIEAAHAAKVSGEEALPDEVGERGLQEE